MVDKAFKPPIEFKKEFETKIGKINFLAGLSLFATRIIEHFRMNVLGADTAELYAIPEGKTFFLASITIFPVEGNQTEAYVETGLGDRIFGGGVWASGTTLSPQTSISSFALPIILRAGETLILNKVNGDAIIFASIVGYEIDSSLIPNFI